MTNLYAIKVKSIDGLEQSMELYKGKVLLIVNTASGCGFTPQYKGLNQLYQDYKDQGLVVLGFPCNQFAHQESGSNSDIRAFCELNFKVSFPLFAKIDVNGDHAHPLYQWLKKEKTGFFWTESIKWNFTKFLVSRSGKVLERYAPQVSPENLKNDIEKALKSK